MYKNKVPKSIPLLRHSGIELEFLVEQGGAFIMKVLQSLFISVA